MTCGGTRKKRHVLLPLLFCLSLMGCQEQEVIDKEVEVQAETTSEITYELTQVSRGSVQDIIYLKCVYTETEEVEVSFDIDQELVAQVLVEKGDSVVKGEVLATVNVEATKENAKKLAHQLEMDELHLKQLIEERDFELEQADILYTYTFMTKDDKKALQEEKENITENYAKRIQNYEDTIYIEKKRLQEYEEYIDKGTLRSPMDGTVNWVLSDLEESLTTKGMSVMRIYNPNSKLYYSENIEAIPYLEEGAEYTITCGLGKAQREYTVMAVNKEEWGEYVYFKLLDEDYDANIAVTGKVAIVIEEKEDALCVNDDAIHSSGEEYYVYTLDENNVRRMQFVEVGLWGDGIVEIVSGLSEGDRVIIK